MKAFWIKFNLTIDDPHPVGAIIGCGVTAESREAALELLKERVFKGEELPDIAEFIDDVVQESLDKDHVIPNMGNQFVKGVWFPLGY